MIERKQPQDVAKLERAQADVEWAQMMLDRMRVAADPAGAAAALAARQLAAGPSISPAAPIAQSAD
jgi:hypothetical protein